MLVLNLINVALGQTKEEDFRKHVTFKIYRIIRKEWLGFTVSFDAYFHPMIILRS